MKTIKIILGLITAITLVFFATGLFVKETNYEVSITIQKPVEEVFKKMINPENTKNWIPEIKEKTIINKNIGVTGSEYQVVVNNQGEDIKMKEKVMAYVPNEKYTLFYDAENMLKTNDYVFTSESNQTTITLNASCTSDSYIMSCLFPYFKGTFKEQDATYLENFKSFVENK